MTKPFVSSRTKLQRATPPASPHRLRPHDGDARIGLSLTERRRDMQTNQTVHGRGWYDVADCRLEDLIEIVEVDTDPAVYPHAAGVEQGAVVYDATRLEEEGADPVRRRAIQAELASVLLDGPGIVVFTGAVDNDAIDRVSASFQRCIDDQHARSVSSGDHFAKAGANDRVWNALEKVALDDPEAFADYYANNSLALVSTAWLGPHYQVTSQVNVVNPGGAAQSPHRDYHLGFKSQAQAAEFPAHVHALSPALTLQGAIAHCDMPVETGPTLYLPHSQKYGPGYLAWWQPEFAEYFAGHHSQLPLRKGDAVYFNPAVFHAAGHNRTTNVRRMANLLQVSSSLGRAMETVDRERMSLRLYPVLARKQAAGTPAWKIANVIAASSEGYAFPTSLDLDPPVGGLAPPTQADVVHQALSESWSPTQLADALADHANRRALHRNEPGWP
jgi:ectoine hydroxylase-related dioxygenase (phytanoyl-CoA dioxygenase family)